MNSFTIKALAGAFCGVLLAASAATAQFAPIGRPIEPLPAPRPVVPEPKIRIIFDTPDHNQGEISRTKEVALEDNRLVRLVINYRNGKHKVSQFLDGKLHRETEQTKDGTVRFTRYKNGKLVEEQVNKNNAIDSKFYRDDGTPWYTTSRAPMLEPVSQYFDKTGKLRLVRTQKRTGQMHVTVLDTNGRELYKQVWVYGINGHVLIAVEEKTSKGMRRLNIRGIEVVSADYLKDDGTVDHTEEAGSISEPVDESRTREFAPEDDPTIPVRRNLPR